METIAIRPWPDPVIDTIGYDARSRYVERFWLPTLGPTAVLLLRRIADALDEEPDGLRLPVAATSRMLGLGDRTGTSSPLVRSLHRLVQFGLACEAGAEFLVRRHVTPVNPRHVGRLPAPLQVEHERWAAEECGHPVAARVRGRARSIGITLLEAGNDPPAVERSLQTVGFRPLVAAEATRWAVARHHALDADHAA